MSDPVRDQYLAAATRSREDRPGDAGVVILWVEQLWTAWVLAKGERAAELRGDRRARMLDGSGLHPYSVCWGQVYALEQLAPDLVDDRESGSAWGAVGQEPTALGHLDPPSLRRRAHLVAQADFAQELRDTGEQVWAS